MALVTRRRIYLLFLILALAAYGAMYVQRRWNGPQDRFVDVLLVAIVLAFCAALGWLRPEPTRYRLGLAAVVAFISVMWLSDPEGPGLLAAVRRIGFVSMLIPPLATFGWILLGASVWSPRQAIAGYLVPGGAFGLIEAHLFLEDIPWSVVYVALWPYFSLGIAQFFGFQLGR
jgi:hypothetical protein